jgi:hypothetical protein
MQALRIYAGPQARRHIERHGLAPAHVGTVPAAAGGPKGLILGPLDRFIFGQWLPLSRQPVDLVGASIGAWRMATACLERPADALASLEHEYIHQHYEVPPGRRRPSPDQVSASFAANLQRFFGGRVGEVLGHPRYRVHVVASRGRRLLAREGRWRMPLGYLAAYVANAMRRSALGHWLERVVFSARSAPLPFEPGDLPTRQVPLTEDNFMPALQASCAIPFVLRAVREIPGAPAGAYWDGGITDYHLHLRYRPRVDAPIVLYPHFQRAVVPGWLDKAWRRRHRATAALDWTVVLAPDPDWVRRLPNGKLPDRTDFERYGKDFAARVRAWGTAVADAGRLAEEFARWLERPDPGRVQAL